MSNAVLWDYRTENDLGRVQTDGTPVVAYGLKGFFFGFAYNSANSKTSGKLHGARNYKEGPFLEFP